MYSFGGITGLTLEQRNAAIARAKTLGLPSYAAGSRAALAQWAPVETPPVVPGRLVFGHYFPPYPISLDNAAAAGDYYAVNYLQPGGEGGKFAWTGGLLRDRPLPVAPNSGDWRLANARREIIQAKAAGLDGFAVNLMSTGPWLWDQSLAIAKAAAGEGGFTVTPMLDASSGIVNLSTEALATALATFYATGAPRLVDGAWLISSFYAEGKTPAWWKTVTDAVAAKIGRPVAFEAVFLNAGANMDAYAPVAVGFGIWGSATPGNAANSPNYAAKAHALGRKWMAPVRVQDARPNQAVYAEAENTTLFRTMWARAAADGADTIQMVTWNDYSESTHLAPSVAHGTAFADLNKLYADAWKTGKPIAVAADKVIVTHRIHPYAAKPTTPGLTPMACTLDGGGTPRDTVEALCILTKPATVVVNGVSRDVPAQTPTPVVGPLRIGAQSVTVGGVQVASPAAVTNTPAVQDMAYHASTT